MDIDNGPQPDADESQPQAAQGHGFSAELMAMPAFQAMLAGSPPAVSFYLRGSEDRSEFNVFKENRPALRKTGFMYMQTEGKDRGIIFNALHIHPADIRRAEKMGKLTMIAPPFDAVNHMIGQSGLQHPLLSTPGPPSGMATPMAPVPPQGAGIASQILGKPLPASTQTTLANQRSRNLQAGAPTSGPAPGAGRLVNSIMKPIV
jgi:hypothetical protein